jgi:hypothetical protein
MPRAYFGAGIFLTIACLRALAVLLYDNDKMRAALPALYIIVALLWLWLFFDYQENLVNLARYMREDNERVAIMEEAKANGLHMAIVPQYRPQFANRYSEVQRHDMQEDPGDWVNTIYEIYYGVKISAIPREEWEALRR